MTKSLAAARKTARPRLGPALVCCGTGFILLGAVTVYNPTGLPLYPDINSGKMDEVARTDKMGHWCNRFSADTSAALPVVEAWYRKALTRPSETDLINDEHYRNYPNLVGVKLAVGIDYVAVFRTGGQGSTLIELVKCSPP